jgi:hypothetical protein
MKTKLKLLTLNEPTRNNHIYTRDVVKAAIDKHIESGKLFPVLREPLTSTEVNLASVIGVVKDFEYKENALLGTVELFPGHEHMLNFHVRPAFMGMLNKDYMVNDLEFIAFYFTKDPA